MMRESWNPGLNSHSLNFYLCYHTSLSTINNGWALNSGITFSQIDSSVHISTLKLYIILALEVT